MRKALADALIAKIGATAHNQLLKDFRAWVDLGPQGEDEHPVFGKDGKNRDSNVLWHVHIIPLDTAAQAQWEDDFENFRKRTSDRLLFYAYDGDRIGYLLIDVIDDPNGHEIFAPKNDQLRAEWQAKAEKFTTFGKLS